jgi:hypothetical protein
MRNAVSHAVTVAEVTLAQHNTTHTPHSTAVDGSVQNSGLCVRAVDLGEA